MFLNFVVGEKTLRSDVMMKKQIKRNKKPTTPHLQKQSQIVDWSHDFDSRF